MRRVYFIRAAEPCGLIKIGCSIEPEHRLASLLIWAPVTLTIEATAPGSFQDEANLQGFFADEHSHGEWFRPSARLESYIRAVREAGALPSTGNVVRLRARPRSLAGVKQSVMLRVTNAEKAAFGVYAPIRYHGCPAERPDDVHAALFRWHMSTDVTAMASDREVLLQYALGLRVSASRRKAQERAAAA